MIINKKSNRGVTLIELTIAISIFSVVMIAATDSFMSVLKNSRESVYKQNMQDHLSFLFSLMSKEIRMAKVNYDGNSAANTCSKYFNETNDVNGDLLPLVVGQMYTVNTDTKSNELRFINNLGQCVRYYFKPDPENNNNMRLKITRYTTSTSNAVEAWVSPAMMKIDNPSFSYTKFNGAYKLSGVQINAMPPTVSYSMTLSSDLWNNQGVTYSNFITARNIEQF